MGQFLIFLQLLAKHLFSAKLAHRKCAALTKTEGTSGEHFCTKYQENAPNPKLQKP